MKHENETQNLNDGLPTDEVFDLSETKIMEEEKKARLEAEFEEEAREEEEISGIALLKATVVASVAT